MSDLTSNVEKINKSPINRSKSKMIYSFSKSIRFEEIKSKGSKTFIYELPNVKNRRSTSLGYGKKLDFVIKHINKKAPYYDIPSDFNAKKPNSPAFSFGVARHFYDRVFSKSGKLLDKNIPGPGRYDNQKSLGSDALKFSLFGRRGTVLFEKVENNPGPGEYSSLNMNGSGKYPISSFRNTTNNLHWANNKESRFFNNKNNIPGPGTYNPKSLINGSGAIFVSRYKSSTAKSLGGRLKEASNKNPTPGPGSYSSFSEFGFYDYRSPKNLKEVDMSQKSSFSSIKKYDPYFSEKRTSSKIFHKYSQSQIEKDFQQNSKNDFDNPVDFNSKILENDKALMAKKITSGNGSSNLKYNLRFDHSSLDKKTPHISELEINQNDYLELKEQEKIISKFKQKNDSCDNNNNSRFNFMSKSTKDNFSNNVSGKCSPEILDERSAAESKIHPIYSPNLFKQNINFKNIKKINEISIQENDSLNHKDNRQISRVQNPNSSISSKKSSELHSKNNFENSVKSDLFKNLDNSSVNNISSQKHSSSNINSFLLNNKIVINEENSKTSAAESNAKAQGQLNSITQQSKHNKEEFLRITENSGNAKSIKLINKSQMNSNTSSNNNISILSHLNLQKNSNKNLL